MSVILECPVCEVRIKVEKIPPRINCPGCKTNFKTPVAEPGPDAVPKSAPSMLAQAPRRLQSAPTGTPPQFPPSPTPPALAGQDPKPLATQPAKPSTASDIQLGAGSSASSAYPARQKKNIWVTVTSLALAIIAIGGLFAIVTILGQPGDTAAQTKSDDLPAEEPDKTSPMDRAVADKNKNEKPALPPVDETPEYFNPRQMELAWNKVNGYMVKLDVKTPIRQRTISGLLVDSRGWVVTSLSGLEDAGEVNVTMASKKLDADPPFRELVDLSRGIIATDPAHDLALISINRAQVINLADVKLKTLDNLVEASRLLIARTPPPRHRRWLAECRIAKRGSSGELSDEMQRAMEKASLLSDANAKWLVYPPRLPTNLAQELAGSPLMFEDGTIVAINTGVTADGNALAIPASYVQKLIDQVGSGAETKPFPRAADLIRRSTSNDSGTAEDDVAVEERNRGAEFEETIRNLTKDVDACRKTDWSAELDTEFASMQSLSKNLSEAFDWKARNYYGLPAAEEYDEMLNSALEEITLSLEDDLVGDEFASGKGNEFFFKQVDEENPWFIISAEVVLDQFNSPAIRQQETVTFEITGTGKHVIAAAGPEARSFRKGRKFLLIGRLDAMGSVSSGLFDGEPQINLINVHSHIQIGLRGNR